MLKKSLKLSIICILSVYTCSPIFAVSDNDLMNKYNAYRQRLINEFILVSPEVEQFGTNIPAVDRKLDSAGNPIWISWSDGNSNFNQWLGTLATEYKLLKINNQCYNETLSMLMYSMIALERLDLYAEYILRKHHNKHIIKNGDTIYNYILLPNDINGFLLRDDVSLGFWNQYHKHFGIEYGKYNNLKNGTNTYRSVFQRGRIPKQGMSQDNIYYLMQALAIVKNFMSPECIKNIEINFINDIIPAYLSEKQIISSDTVYFCRWVDDIVDRLLRHIRQEYPKPEMVLKPFRGNWRAQVSKNRFFGIMSTRWYIMNPVTDSIVREGSGEDMGVWINSYGAAQAAYAITGNNIYHYDGSEKGLSRYIFKSLVFKNFRIARFGGIPVPSDIDDYMFRALASIADINWTDDSYKLLHLLRDRRQRKTYEHNPLILYLLHKEKYSNIYHPGISYYDEDKEFYKKLLKVAPINGPTTDKRVADYHPVWTSSSRLTWPVNHGRKEREIWDFAGMDFMYLHNLYKLVFDNSDYKVKPINNLNTFHKKHTKSIRTLSNIEYFYMPPEIKK